MSVTRRSLVCCAAFLALGGCRLLEPPATGKAPADLTLRGVVLDQYQHGILTAKARMSVVGYERADDRAHAERLRLHPLSNGTSEGTLASLRADARLGKRVVELSGGTRWVSTGGDEMSAPRCHIDLSTRRFRGDDPVSLSGPGYQAKGDRFHGRYGPGGRLVLEGHAQAATEGAVEAGAQAATRGER